MAFLAPRPVAALESPDADRTTRTRPLRYRRRSVRTIRPRVAIVDDTTAIRSGLPQLLPEFSFGGSFPDCESLLKRHPAVDVVVLDIHLSGTGRTGIRQGPDAVRACTDAGYRVCIYSAERRQRLLLRCLQAGARGVVHKAEPTETLSEAIRQVASGVAAISTGLAGLADLVEHHDRVPTLTDRQRQVLAGRARSDSFRSIARRLSISEKTAQEHWSVVTSKFADYLRNHSAADLERLLGWDIGEPDPDETLAASR